MKVSFQWILRHGFANVRIAHVDAEGNVEPLIPERRDGTPGCDGPDANLEFTRIAISPGGFSEFSLLALVDKSPAFAASNLRGTPEVVEPGDAVKISVDVANEGDQPGSFSAILEVKEPGPGSNFQAVAVKELTLLPRSDGTINFFLQKEVQGRYSVQVENLEPVAFDVFREILPANLSFSPIVFSATEVEVGDSIRVSTIVRNAGEEAGRIQIALRLNDALSEILSVVVPGNGALEVFFDFIPPAEGTFRIALVDITGQIQTLEETVTAIIPVLPFDPRLLELNVSPLEVDPGTVLTVSLRVENLGEVAGVETVAVEIDGRVVKSQDIEVDVLSVVPATLMIDAPDEPGDYTLSVAGTKSSLSQAFKVIERLIERPLRVVSISPIPGTVAVGRVISIRVDVENPGDLENRRTLIFRLDGVPIEERTVILAGGDTRTEIFEFNAPADVGTHRFDLEGVAGTERTFEVVDIIVPAVQDLISLDVSPVQVEAGDLVTITVLLRNSGEEQGTTDVILKINGQVVETRRGVIIPGNDERMLSFEVTRDEVRGYEVEVEVRRLTGTFSVEEIIILPPKVESLTVTGRAWGPE